MIILLIEIILAVLFPSACILSIIPRRFIRWKTFLFLCFLLLRLYININWSFVMLNLVCRRSYITLCYMIFLIWLSNKIVWHWCLIMFLCRDLDLLYKLVVSTLMEHHASPLLYPTYVWLLAKNSYIDLIRVLLAVHC